MAPTTGAVTRDLGGSLAVTRRDFREGMDDLEITAIAFAHKTRVAGPEALEFRVAVEFPGQQPSAERPAREDCDTVLDAIR